MTITPKSTVYTQSSGTTSTSTFVDVFLPRAPTENDVNYQIQQKWCDTSLNSAMPPEPKNDYYVLTGFSSMGGSVEAQWTPLGSISMLEQFTTDIGGPVTPTGNSIYVAGGTGIQTNGGTAPSSTLTINLEVPVTVSNGGTGLTSLTPYGLLAGGMTSTSVVQQVGVGFANEILTSNGPGMLPTFQALVLPTESLVVNSVVITYAMSPYTYNPSSGLAYAIVEVVGGGGGGGGCAATVEGIAAAGGGGSGGYSRKVISSSVIGASQTVTIGAAGSAGASGNNAGGNGGTTSFGTGPLLQATGGTGGQGSPNTQSGIVPTTNSSAGGSGSSGDINTTGNPGGIGYIIDVAGTGALAIGGVGAGSYFGGGAIPVSAGATKTVTGNAATSYGGGGGGGIGLSTNTAVAGGAGYAGLCVITEYIGGFATSFTWTDGSGTFTANPQMGYFLTAASTATLPASPTEGITIAFVCDTASACTITANAGQKIRIGNSTSSVAGSATSTKQGDSLTLVYRTSDLVWFSLSTEGNWSLT